MEYGARKGVPGASSMADLYQSSLFEPSAPQENLLHKVTRKKQPKVVSELDCTATTKTPPTASHPSRSSHTLAPFYEYFTKRRKINNNNNNSKFSSEHISKVMKTRKGDSHSSTANRGRRFNFFPGKQTSEPSSARESTTDSGGLEKNETTQSQKLDANAEQSGSLRSQTKDEMEVLCHGLLRKTDSLGQKCLLSHPSHETDSDTESVHKSTGHELGVLLVAVGKNNSETRSNENEVASKYEKFVDSSDMQEKLNNINLKRCKDTVMPQSIRSTATLPGHSESLSIPPVIEETEEGSAEEPPVVEVFLPQREPPLKEPKSVVPVHNPDGSLGTHGNTDGSLGTHGNTDGSLGTHGNTKQRHKLHHILRRLLSVNSSLGKEDKQRLVEEEEDDDEEQVMAETNVDEQEVQVDASKTASTHHDTEAVASEKKRRPGAKDLCRGWGRRVRRSLSRGCHYLGLGVLSITNYIPEAAFMGPVIPSKNYDGEYIYTSNDYVIYD